MRFVKNSKYSNFLYKYINYNKYIKNFRININLEFELELVRVDLNSLLYLHLCV